jgi:hypothetical protein
MPGRLVIRLLCYTLSRGARLPLRLFQRIDWLGLMPTASAATMQTLKSQIYTYISYYIIYSQRYKRERKTNISNI